jgi:hypothetical protein
VTNSSWSFPDRDGLVTLTARALSNQVWQLGIVAVKVTRPSRSGCYLAQLVTNSSWSLPDRDGLVTLIARALSNQVWQLGIVAVKVTRPSRSGIRKVRGQLRKFTK